MARLDIERSRRLLPSTTGLPRQSTNQQPDLNISTALSNLGGVLGDMAEEERRIVDNDYISQASIQATERITESVSEIERTAPATLISSSVATSVDSIHAELLKNAPSKRAKQVLQQQFTTQRNQYYKSANALQNQKIKNNAIEAATKGANGLINRVRQNPALYAEAVKELGFVKGSLNSVTGKDGAREVNQKLTDELQEAFIEGTMLKNADEGLSLLSSGKFDDMDPNRFESLMNMGLDMKKAQKVQKDKIENDANSKILEQHKIALLRNANNPSGLISLSREYDKRFQEGELGLDELTYLTMKKQIDEAKPNAIDNQQRQARVISTLTTGVGIDPTDRKDVAAMDTYFAENVLSAIQEKEDPQERLDQTLQFVRSSNIIPSTLKATLNAGINSNNIKVKHEAAATIVGIAKSTTGLSKQFDDDTLVQASKIMDGVAAGLKIEEINKILSTQPFDRNSDIYKQKLSMFNKTELEFDEGEFTKFFTFGEPDQEDIPPQILSEFKSLVKVYNVDQNMSIDSAKELAYSRLRENWSISKSQEGELRYLKYAPEAKYPGVGLSGSHDWVYDDLEKSYIEATGRSFSMENIMLVPVPDTIDGDTRYYILDRTGTGVYAPLQSGGRDIQFQPSMSDVQQKEIDNIRRRRDELKAIREGKINPLSKTPIGQ